MSLKSVEQRQQTSAAASTEGRSPSTAKAAVEQGLVAFEKGDVQESLRLYRLALSLKPTADEARAATYNSACALAKLKQFKAAADGVVAAVNDYGLKLDVAVKV